MILRNREGFADFDIRPGWHENRVAGLSGLLRVRNEAMWVDLAIASFLPWLDELIIVVQPSEDDTRAIVDRYRSSPKVRIYDYPWKSWPMGPGHDACPADSVSSAAYFYNFAQAQSTRTHAVKLDGDMVMMDWSGAEVIRLFLAGHERIKFHGTDLVGDDLRHIGCNPNCPTNGVYRVTASTWYRQGPLTQNLQGLTDPTADIHEPAFLHFKWARKPLEAATMQWPAGWQEMPHFQRIYARRLPVAEYRGEYPASVRELLA
ncbi:MAG TPA: hypothetical protein VMX97_16535 [Hyphomicrobiaceae bacterium]|nr:hypothetical protein [Hyphomicrobiaceae bacterium]